MPVDLPTLRAYCDAATPGPWELGKPSELGSVIVRGVAIFGTLGRRGQQEVDATFCALARDAVPELLEHIELLEKKLAEPARSHKKKK